MKKDKERKELEPWQAEDADRLRRLFAQRWQFSQEKFAADFDLGSQGNVWQYLNGWIPLNLPAALKFAKGLGVSVADISPTWAKLLGAAPQSPARVDQAITHPHMETWKSKVLEDRDFLDQIARKTAVLHREETARKKTQQKKKGAGK